ncbi:MAG: transglutaminase TgpA family protein [Candidatus Rokuibacteriota bacterium]
MRTLSALRLATTLAVGAGVGALHLGALLGAAGLAVALLALAGGWWLRERAAPSRGLTRTLTAILALAAAVDVLFVAAVAFDAFVRLLVVLTLLRLLAARRPRDLRDAGMLAFFMPVAASAVTMSVGFVFILVAYVIAAVTMLVIAHDVGEAERAGAGPAELAELRTGRGVAVIGLAGAVVTFGVTIALFFVIPRVGEATLALRGPDRKMLIGFTDRVELGAIGQLENDATVAMRVQLPGGAPSPALLPYLRWRGITLDHYDGLAWSGHRQQPRLVVRRGPEGPIEVQPPRGAGVHLRQIVFLEPIGSDAVFAAPHALTLWARGGAALVNDGGAITVPTPSARLQYTVDSVVGAGPWGGPLDAAAAARYRQLPPLSPRIATLAREVTSGARSQAAAASALTAFLSRDFLYTLTLERRTDLDPLEEFLFVRRSGNCEYFAAALAVMLRTLGVPARVVNGFQRGAWNPYGEYFLVRMGDAHSWVEAHVDGAGWITLDPSPRGALDADTAWATALWVDALRVRWYRYIVGWSRQDQVQAAAALQQAAARPWRLPWRDLTVPAWVAVPALAAVAAVVGWLAWRGMERSGLDTRPPARPPDFYRRALRALARRGLRPASVETAREFASRVSAAFPPAADSFAHITRAYETVRFGDRDLDPATAHAVHTSLAALRTAR